MLPPAEPEPAGLVLVEPEVVVEVLGGVAVGGAQGLGSGSVLGVP